jgi:hypothetical protein
MLRLRVHALEMALALLTLAAEARAGGALRSAGTTPVARAPNARPLHSPAALAPRSMRLRGGSEVQSAVGDAINSMRSRALDAGMKNEAVLEALKLMLLYTENVVKNPAEVKFRRIKAGNKAFAAQVAPVGGAVEVLAACGFTAVQEAATDGAEPELFYKLPADAAVASVEAAVQEIKNALAFSKRVTSETLGAMVTTGVEEGAIEEVWRLSCTLEGHSADVRGVAVTHENKIVTGSRDGVCASLVIDT